jgi:hypothetical protein
MRFRGLAAFALGLLAAAVPAACPSIDPNLGLGGGGASSMGSGGSGGGGMGFGGFSQGGAGTVGPGGSFGLGGGMPATVTSGPGGGAGCVSCAKALQLGGADVCPGLPSDAYAALGACACVGTCASMCKTTLCEQGPAGVACGACLVSACPDQQAQCSVE